MWYGATLFRSILVFILIDCFFAFPLEIPYPFFICAIIFGPILLISAPQANRIVFSKFWLLPLFVMITSIGSDYVESKYLESQDQFQKLAYACDVFPSNWHACLHRAHTEFDFEDFEAAYETSSMILSLYKDNYPAMWVRGFSAFELGKKEESCLFLTKYDRLFNSKSSISDFVLKNCSRSKRNKKFRGERN